MNRKTYSRLESNSLSAKVFVIKKRHALSIMAAFCLILSSLQFLPAQGFLISAEVVNSNTVRIDFIIPEGLPAKELILYRSTAPLSGSNINTVRYPVAEFRIDFEQAPPTFFDHNTAHNVIYNYLAIIRQKGRGESLATSNTIKVSIPDVPLEELDDPVVLINKRYYYLEIRNKGHTAKRYPISLGRDPFTRKLHQDNKTTPEGLYKIINLQTKATFYKAIDIDYPNSLDRIRYDFMKAEGLIPEGRGIGGEIQIHGQAPRWGSIQRNWTWGCISLRNSDMDEILNLSSIKVGIPVVITGSEFSLNDKIILEEERSLDDIKAVQKKLAEMGLFKGKIDGTLGRQTRFSIGRYQIAQGLPISCALDSRTIKILKSNEKK